MKLKLQKIRGYAVRDGNFILLRTGWCRISKPEIFEVKTEHLFTLDEADQEMINIDNEGYVINFAQTITDAIGPEEKITFDAYDEISNWTQAHWNTPEARDIYKILEVLNDTESDDNFLIKAFDSLGQQQLAWIRDILFDYMDRGYNPELRDIWKAILEKEKQAGRMRSEFEEDET